MFICHYFSLDAWLPQTRYCCANVKRLYSKLRGVCTPNRQCYSTFDVKNGYDVR